jgi:hypothetical protein
MLAQRSWHETPVQPSISATIHSHKR